MDQEVWIGEGVMGAMPRRADEMEIGESRGWLCDGCGKDWDVQPDGFEVFVGSTRGFLGLCRECREIPACRSALRQFVVERTRARAISDSGARVTTDAGSAMPEWERAARFA